MNKIILLKNRPHGKPTLHDFKISNEEMPAPKDCEVLMKRLENKTVFNQ
jgi:NADPH:quinone reductase